MPELPEVEHARKTLARALVGKVVVRIALPEPRVLGDDATAKRARELVGLRVRDVERRGKWLRVSFAGGADVRLFSHLGMTGKWIAVDPSDAAEARFEKAQLEVRGRGRRTTRVRYLDPRMFGAIWVADRDIEAWRSLGPDPIVDGIDVARLGGVLARRRAPVKVALLDQSVLAGVGNIHAIEALFRARIDPRRPSASLSLAEVRNLARAVSRSLEDALAAQADDVDIAYFGEGAHVENPFAIYGREGQPCPRCRSPLAKIVLAGRGTVLCARCQR